MIQGRVGRALSLTTKKAFTWLEGEPRSCHGSFQEHRHGPTEAEGQVSGGRCRVRQSYSWRAVKASFENGTGAWVVASVCGTKVT